MYSVLLDQGSKYNITKLPGSSPKKKGLSCYEKICLNVCVLRILGKKLKRKFKNIFGNKIRKFQESKFLKIFFWKIIWTFLFLPFRIIVYFQYYNFLRILIWKVLWISRSIFFLDLLLICRLIWSLSVKNWSSSQKCPQWISRSVDPDYEYPTQKFPAQV